MDIGRHLRILALILATACVLAAQSAHPTAQKEPRFSIFISVEPESVEAGAEVWVKATLTNKAKATTFADLTDKAKDKIILDVTLGHPERDFDVRMYDAEGYLASLTYYGHQVNGEGNIPLVDNMSGVMLRPQDSYKSEIELSQLYDLTRPGKYTIQVQRGDDFTKGVAKSNTVTLTIKPKQ